MAKGRLVCFGLLVAVVAATVVILNSYLRNPQSWKTRVTSSFQLVSNMQNPTDPKTTLSNLVLMTDSSNAKAPLNYDKTHSVTTTTIATKLVLTTDASTVKTTNSKTDSVMTKVGTKLVAKTDNSTVKTANSKTDSVMTKVGTKLVAKTDTSTVKTANSKTESVTTTKLVAKTDTPTVRITNRKTDSVPSTVPTTTPVVQNLELLKEWTSKSISDSKQQCASIIQADVVPLPSNVGCQIAFMDPMHPSIMKYISRTADPQCSGRRYAQLVDGILKFTDADVVSATYQAIKRNGETSYAMGQRISVSPGTKIADELIEVDFLLKNGNHAKEHFVHVIPRENVLKREAKKSPGIPMNILVMGMDSVSHAGAQRKLPKIYEFLRDELSAFMFNGHSSTGDGTVEQMAPMLTGLKFFEELYEARPDRANSRTVDGWPWIYNQLKEHGYITGYSEDGTHFGPFNWRLKGFQSPPTDFYPLPFFRKMKSLMKGGDQCVGAKNVNQYQYDYVRSLFKVFPDKLKFFVSFAVGYSHHDLNRVAKFQRDFFALLQGLKASGFLNNTLLIVMGDHGVRWGSVRGTIQGKLEERLPFLSMTFPPWFLARYPKLVANLRTNTDRLTTWYDVYATFRHILSYPDLPTDVKHGQSLFTEVPITRTCKGAHVPEFWCPCLRWSAVDTKHSHVQNAALAAIEYINYLISNNSKTAKQCDALSLKSVSHSLLERPNDQVLRFIHVDLSYTPRFRPSNNPPQTYFCRYQIQFITSPNNAIYVVNARYYKNYFTISTDITRVNKNSDESKCISTEFPHLKNYCFCKTSVW